MARRKYQIDYALNGTVATKTYKADDAACALGILLDEHEYDVEYDWIRVQRADSKLPAGVREAYSAALGGAK